MKWTVGKLREIIKDAPDNAEISIGPKDILEDSELVSIKYFSVKELDYEKDDEIEFPNGVLFITYDMPWEE